MKKNETAKYILITDHRAGFNHLDKTIALESTDMLHAMNEAFNAVYEDEERYNKSFGKLYAMYIYEKASSSRKGCVAYNEILRGNFRLNDQSVSGNTFSGWEPVLTHSYHYDFDYINEVYV